MKIGFSIRTMITLAISSCVTAIGVISGAWQFFYTAAQIEKENNVFVSSLLDGVKKTILDEISSVDEDLSVIRGNANLNGMLESPPEGGKNLFKNTTQEVFLSIAEVTKKYDQIRYIDESGMEIVRVNFDGSDTYAVPEEGLQNKKGRYYFDDAFKLDAGEIFISPLDLNIERGKIEEPFKPMLRYATPVFDSKGKKRGIVILNYLANIFLERVKEKQKSLTYRELFLLNKEGYFLANPDLSMEWGFMLENGENFQKYYPDIVNQILAGENGKIIARGFEFDFIRIYPVPGTGDCISSTGSNVPYEPSEQYIGREDYYWILVLKTPLSVIENSLVQVRARFVLTGGLFVLVSFCLAFWIASKISKPIFKLKKEISGFDIDKVPFKMAEVPNQREIGSLAGAFNTLLKALEKSRTELTSARDYADSVISNMVDPLVIITPGGYIKDANKATCDLLGYAKEELVDRRSDVVIDKAEMFFRGEGLEKLVKEGTVRDLEAFLKTKDGQKIPVSVAGSVTRKTAPSAADKQEKEKNTGHSANGTGEIEYIICVSRDVRHTNALLRELAESRDKLAGHAADLEDAVRLRTKALDEAAKEIEESRDVTMSVLEDTVEAKEKLEKAMKELKTKESEIIQMGKLAGIGEMAAGVAHEINNPLTSVIGYAQLILANKIIDPSMREDLECIEKESKRCVEIVENLLAFSRPQPAKKEDIDVKNIVEATLKVVEYSVQRERIEIVKDYTSWGCKVCADPYQLQQVFMNIIINAVNAMRPAGGTLTVGIRGTGPAGAAAKEEDGGKKEGEVAVFIKDTGIGMDDETTAKIFNPFFSTALKRGQKGTGLGLSISYSIVTEHGGRIEVESEVGKGSTFTVVLPACQER